MKFSRFSRAGSLVVAAGIAAGVFSAPAGADTTANIDNFLTTLDGLGITDIAPGDAVELGQSLCPLLADRGQNTADIAAKVSDAIGRPLGPATMFTGMAISFLCPKAVGNITDTLTNGKPLLPLFG
ncbi:MAG: DUF732 domain-containing protein [Mycobacterium sp.]|jgi:hypothetical protein